MVKVLVHYPRDTRLMTTKLTLVTIVYLDGVPKLTVYFSDHPQMDVVLINQTNKIVYNLIKENADKKADFIIGQIINTQMDRVWISCHSITEFPTDDPHHQINERAIIPFPI